jgi:hypothetical protein
MEVPTYVTGMVVATTVIVVLAIVVVLRRARERAAGQTRIPEAIGVALFAWLATTAALALAGVYRATPGQTLPGVPILFAIGLGGAWMAATTIPSLRALIGQPATQQSLVALHVWRMLGNTFLILFALGKLPALFALPAGLGDIAAGLAAPFVARRLHEPGGRSWALGWNVFGLLDLIVAIGLGVTVNQGPLQVFRTDPSAVVMTGFPMALVPTFMVPMSMLLHILSLQYLLGARNGSVGTPIMPARHLESWRS